MDNASKLEGDPFRPSAAVEDVDKGPRQMLEVFLKSAPFLKVRLSIGLTSAASSPRGARIWAGVGFSVSTNAIPLCVSSPTIEKHAGYGNTKVTLTQRRLNTVTQMSLVLAVTVDEFAVSTRDTFQPLIILSK